MVVVTLNRIQVLQKFCAQGIRTGDSLLVWQRFVDCADANSQVEKEDCEHSTDGQVKINPLEDVRLLFKVLISIACEIFQSP